MGGQRPRWGDESPRDEEIVRLDDREYRILLATAAQQVAGRIARAIEADDGAAVDSLGASLLQLATALGSGAPGLSRQLVPNEGVRLSLADPGGGARLLVGGSPTLWDGLRPLLRDARELDVVVAYCTVEGVRLLREFLEREARRMRRLRLLTGCYLGGTRPDALRQLLDWAGTSPASVLEIRFVADPGRHFHPKAYRVVDATGTTRVVIGSTNLSRSALDGDHAVEWNVMFDLEMSASLVRATEAQLDRVFATEGVPLDEAVVVRFEKDARRMPPPDLLLWDRAVGENAGPPTATPAQQEALAGLDRVRADGNTRALVVAATGLGKTILAALDSLRVAPPGSGRRILFVAHREELLTQARRAFEQVRGPGETHGLLNQYEASTHADAVYASVFSLSKLTDAELAHFDYVVIDEAHHAAARSYERVVRGSHAAFVLGLTATPERADGGDIFALFDGVVAYEKPLLEAIEAGWLARFRYFGVPDTVDYRDLAWVGGSLGYREADLEKTLLDDQRMARVLDALAQAGREGTRTLFFCININHAKHTVAALAAAGWRVARVDSRPDAHDRADAIARLKAGTLDAIVAVDMFNEGLDIPQLDRVVFLRPTDSKTIFLQQLGRGLRTADGKDHLTVVDLVGNHRRAQEHLSLLGASAGDLLATPASVSFVARIGRNELFVEPEAIEAIRAAGAARLTVRARLVDATRDLSAQARGDGLDLARASLVQVLAHTGLTVATVRALFGSWRGLLNDADCLTEADRQVDDATTSLYDAVESTNMSGPHKMLLLGAMARRAASSVSIGEAAAWMRDELLTAHPSARSAMTGTDVESWLSDGRPHGALPRVHPMEKLSGAHARHFELSGGVFTMRGGRELTATQFGGIVERADARLFDLARRGRGAEIVGKIMPQGAARLCLQLDQQARRVGESGSWVRLEVGTEVVFGRVMAIAINVFQHRPTDDEEENLATEILMRAAEAATPDEARRRTLRLTPAPAGGFSLELFVAEHSGRQRK